MQNPRFLTRVFSDAENALFQSRGFSVQTVAANFCAKEAFAKALGTGIRGFALREVAALRDERGKPYLQLSGNAKRIAEERRLCFDVSLTHTREYAAAVVIACEREEGGSRDETGNVRRNAEAGGADGTGGNDL